MDRSPKSPFHFPTAMRLLRAAVKPYPKAAMFELADEGFATLFQQLIACIISIRTLEKVTLATARNLFKIAKTPEKIAQLSINRIDDLIHPCTFHFPKAKNIHAISNTIVEQHNGHLPPDPQIVQSFPGVGPKCANLAIGVSTNHPIGIPVDIHVHRVTNRWGVITARTPEKTMEQLEKILPKRYWLEINKLLVPFGKHVCQADRPHCPTCPLLKMCKQVGVEKVGTPQPAPAQKRPSKTNLNQSPL